MNLTNRQFVLFGKMLSSNFIATVGEYTFKIEQRVEDVYELNQYYKGSKTLLYAGTIEKCIDTAKECVKMMYIIEN